MNNTGTFQTKHGYALAVKIGYRKNKTARNNAKKYGQRLGLNEK